MPQPVFLVIAEDEEVRQGLSADLRRRFAADYRVVGVASPTTALTMLADLARASEDVTLLISDERLTEMHPAAKRVLLVERGDWSSTHPAISAMALGQIDYHRYNPWRPLERILYTAVSEFWPRGRSSESRRPSRSGSSALSSRGTHTNCEMCSRAAASPTGSSIRTQPRVGHC
jgi:hypothetical protein